VKRFLLIVKCGIRDMIINLCFSYLSL
jgi:hypothetical protein